jgi:phosphoglycolate phosphatase-like HAD superfamily hydrolase
MDQREAAMFEAFVVTAKKKRYLELLATRRGRNKVRSLLDHFGDLDPEFSRTVPPAKQNPAAISKLLKNLGAPPLCYVMSSNSELDGRELALDVALAEIVGHGFGALISCIPGNLSYFEGESPRRYICHKNC